MTKEQPMQKTVFALSEKELNYMPFLMPKNP